MDLETLERILREGPPDEPMYIPGAFRRAAPHGRWLMASIAIGLALVIGVAAGLQLEALREQRTGTEVTSAGLQGRWLSESVSREEWFTRLEAQGFDRAEVTALFDTQPFERIEYALDFVGGSLSILSRIDDRPIDGNSQGSFTLVDGDTLVYNEEPVLDPALGNICTNLTAHVDLQDDRLVISDVQLPDNLCGRHIRLIHAAFFTLAPFHRSSE